MKLFVNYITIIFISCSLFACKRVQKITNSDNSTSTATRKKTKRKVEFIDGIEITPGSVVKSKHKPATTKEGNSEIEAMPTSIAAKKVNVEKLTNLQLKYAIILDTYVENLTNNKLLEVIDDWWGTRYCLGGTSKQCIDCSAFTGELAKDVYKINLPRTAADQYNVTIHVNRESLKEGDLVFFKTRGGYISHVGFYLCNNKFVHASTSSGVMISDLNEKYWANKYAGAGRIVQ